MKKNKRSIYKLYKTKADEYRLEANIMQVISSVPLFFTAINQRNFKGDIIDFIKLLIFSSIPFVGVTSIEVAIQSINGAKLLKICKLINDKTGEKIDFYDANITVSGFQDSAKETNVAFEFDNFYIKECIKDDVYRCGLYYSDGGFTDLTNEVSDIIKVHGGKDNKYFK